MSIASTSQYPSPPRILISHALGTLQYHQYSLPTKPALNSTVLNSRSTLDHSCDFTPDRTSRLDVAYSKIVLL